MNFKAVFVLLLASSIFSSCATIVGGTYYTANVVVKDHSDALITYNGIQKGQGIAQIKIPRVKSNSVSFVVSKTGCKEQSFSYTGRVIRGWAVLGTLVTWTGYPLPIPYGLVVDLTTGAVFKPDVKENGIIKNDYKSYNYILNYTGCENKPIEETNEIQERLMVLKNLFFEGLISAEEYEREKKKILEKL